MDNYEEVRNEAGGLAYNLESAHELCQYAVTGCLRRTFYTTAAVQQDAILKACEKVDPEIVAKVAVYARERGYMKDVPALLCVWLSARGHIRLLEKIFNRVIDNGKMLRKFVELLRSGVTGRKSHGTTLKKLIANWLNIRTAKEIFSQSVGNDPSFRDILRLAHPKPLDRSKNALYRWFLGKEYEEESLPEIVRQFEDYKAGRTRELPAVPFEMLTSLKLNQEEWSKIALRAGWHWLRMNLNTMRRHGVFDNEDMVDTVASRLSDVEEIRRVRVFPYQLLAAYLNSENDIPHKIKEALQDAMEIAIDNVPSLGGNGFVAVDVSGSMKHPITGKGEKGKPTKVRCVDVAGLLASAILRKNPSSTIVPFEEHVRTHDINPRDSVMTNAVKLSQMGGGGTNCSSPLFYLNERGAKGDWFVLISDNQSWVDSLKDHPMRQKHYNCGPGHTEFMKQWDIFKERNAGAKMLCLDIAPYKTVQSQDRSDIMNIGGFSDVCFTIMEMFFGNELEEGHWLKIIEKVEL